MDAITDPRVRYTATVAGSAVKCRTERSERRIRDRTD